MRHPFQCLEVCSLAGTADANVLIAAAGSYIYSYSLNDGSLLATWPPSEIEGEGAIRENVQGGEQATRKRRELIPGSVEVNGDIEPPGKRRKLSAPGETSDSTSTEIVVEGATDVGASRMGPRPAVIKLATTSDGKYVIAVTGDDKCIRVLKLLQDGVLQELSERQMPKRPCAITVTPDNATILCADKFGDVYSLPLLGSPLENFNSATTGTEKLKNQSPDTTGKAFVPAASSLTVHTKKNQQALRNQLKVINKTTEKKIFSFEHQLLLGHVSLLTDLAYVTFDARSSRSEGSRSYILTSDRDEHIRVSRGIPQAHIIEGYCLGHTEFVNKIIVPYWRRQVLISGGGDDYLSVWDWVAGTMLQKADLLHPFNCFQDTLMCSRMRSSDLGVDSAKRDRNRIKIAVSGIWAMKHRVPSDEGYEGELFVACEG
ncbi:MAG: tRNA (guanine-N(7)-)-methyltransferase non-catalytic subunit trm82, partial [Pleopsidium flavum]